VKIKPVWNLNAFDIDEIDGLNRGMNGVLIIEILIKFTIFTSVFSAADFEIDASFHMMEARAFRQRPFF
jgi:hypothetical protein